VLLALGGGGGVMFASAEVGIGIVGTPVLDAILNLAFLSWKTEKYLAYMWRGRVTS